jgi:hypothetical protein
VKTRIGAVIGQQEAARLYKALLLDTLRRCSMLNVDIRFYLEGTERAIDRDLLEFDRAQLRQQGEGLGPRMTNAFDDTFSAGYARVVIIGSDMPTLPPLRITQAFDSLSSERTVVLGPALDGGYYLLGLSRPCPQLFEGMSYTHRDVLSETLARCSSADLQPILLEPWYDVDTVNDLRRLAEDLTTGDGGCPATRSFLISRGLIENTSANQGSASEKPYFEHPPQK